MRGSVIRLGREPNKMFEVCALKMGRHVLQDAVPLNMDMNKLWCIALIINSFALKLVAVLNPCIS